MQKSGPTFTNNFQIKQVAFYKFEGSPVGYTSSHLASLTGAPDGAQFTFQVQGGRISILATHPGFLEAGKPMERILSKTQHGLNLFNVQFHVRAEYRRDGIGYKMLSRQIKACRELRVRSISYIGARWETNASGVLVPLDGYMVWPKLGFDGEIPANVMPLLEPRFAHHGTIQQLLQAQGGLEQWQRHGNGCRLTFDVDPGSLNSQIFAAYGKRKGFFP